MAKKVVKKKTARKKVSKTIPTPKKSKKREGMFSLIAALIVLFSAMVDPLVSATLAIAILVFYGFYKLSSKN